MGPSQPPGVALQAAGRWAGAARVTAAGWGVGVRVAAAPAAPEVGWGKRRKRGARRSTRPAARRE